MCIYSVTKLNSSSPFAKLPVESFYVLLAFTPIHPSNLIFFLFCSGPGCKRLGIDGDREAIPLTLQITYSKVRKRLFLWAYHVRIWVGKGESAQEREENSNTSLKFSSTGSNTWGNVFN